MIEVNMDLKSAISPTRDERLCNLVIANVGTGTASRGSYDVRLYARGNGRLIRTARIENYDRVSLPAWRLLAAAMKALEDA